MAKINGGYSAFSFGPSYDTTPHDGEQSSVPHMSMEIPTSTPQMGALADESPYGGIGMYGSNDPAPAMDSFETMDAQHSEVPAMDSFDGIGPRHTEVPAMDSEFEKLEHKLSHQKGVTDPAGLAASIGRKELGEKEMARRSAEGRK